MTNNAYRQHDSGSSDPSNAMPVWVELAILVFIAAIVGSIGLVYMNQKRQIAALDQQIVSLEKDINSIRSFISNKRTEQEALKSSKVVDFARMAKMTIPAPGQVCFLDPMERADQQGTVANSIFGNLRSFNMASITQKVYPTPYTVTRVEDVQ